MSKIWTLMLLTSIITLLFVNPTAALQSMLSGSNAALTLALTLVAMYGFWLGFFAILEKTGISNLISKLLGPLVRFLFKGSSKEAQKLISLNMAANLIGLGNAATPMGIGAIKQLDSGTKKANTNMIMLVVISSTSLQLLPTTVIGLRSQHASADPTSFLLACFVATIVSTVVGVTLVKILSRIFKDEGVKKGKEKKALPLLPTASL